MPRTSNSHTLAAQCLAEVFGTFILVFFGIGSVHAAVITGAQVGIWQVAVVWGVGIALAIYSTSAISGAHLNPAVTLALAAYRGFSWHKVAPYVLAQLIGAILAAAVLYGLFHDLIAAFETAKGLVRGRTGSELSGMVYGEYFPNPAMAAATPALKAVSIWAAMFAEMLGTAVLAFVIFAVTDERNAGRPADTLAPLLIGFTVSLLISILAPISQAGFNPARDFGPRLFACFAGWGAIAIPGPRGGFFTVYVLSPCIGALIGGGLYQFVLRRAFPPELALLESDPRKKETGMKQTQMILVGGFLGAGKTTLLARAAAILAERGKIVGVITNDQAADLVDTASLKQITPNVKEIAGGCFCCRFGQLIETAGQLVAEIAPDIIIGEPVGSCTDISATVLQPLKDLYADPYRLTPFSVLVDPKRLREALEPNRLSSMHPSARYILRKQLEEADLIVINKADLLDSREQRELITDTDAVFPGKPVHVISALTGDGVAEWLDHVLSGDAVGTRIVDVDYDIYAEGEAVLGWLNSSATLTAVSKPEWKALGLTLLNGIRDAAAARQAEIAHLKLTLTAPSGQYVANLTSTAGIPVIHGGMDDTERVVSLVVNARIEMAPETLQEIVEEVLRSVSREQVTVERGTLRSLSPGRPVPTHRYAVVV